MSSLRKFEILLDRPDHKFVPGEVVAGRLFVEFSAPQTMRGIKVKLEGEALVEWSETHTRIRNNRTEYYTEYFRNHETYVDIERYVLIGPKNSDEVKIQAGSYIYPFAFRLPFNIPDTLYTFYGGIEYRVRGIVDRPWRLNHYTAKNVVVEAPYDLSHLPMIALDDEKNNSFCCLYFIDMGSMKVNILLPTSNFAIGETIEVKIKVDNKSKSVNVTGVELRLEQIITCYAAGSSRFSNKTLKTVKQSELYSKKDEIVISIEVPRALCSNATRFCAFIGLQYRLHVVIKVSGCHLNIRRSYPIQIGTKSPRSVQPVQQGNINSSYFPSVGAFPVQSQTAVSTMPMLHNPRAVGTQSPTKTGDELNPVASSVPIRSYGSISSAITPTAPLLDNYTVGVNEK